jgi:predicted RNase H-like HicB family nuclease
MKSMAYCVYREEELFVAQCLNLDVSSFGSNREEAVANLKEAVELYFEGESPEDFTPVTDLEVGQEPVNA